MDLRQLAAVVAVAEEGGFTAAAQRLHTVQSTVSTVVRALERDLGTPLFHRTTHRVALTPAGEAFVPAARAALEAVERARAAISPVHGRVRLGLVPGLLLDLHRVLTAVRDAHPGLVVEVRQLTPDSLGDALAESTVDIAVGVFADTGSGLADPRDTAGAGPGSPSSGGNPGPAGDPRTETSSARLGSAPPPGSGGNPSPAGDPRTETSSARLGSAPPPDSGGNPSPAGDPRTETSSARLGSTPPPDSDGHPSPAGDPRTETSSARLGSTPLPDSDGHPSPAGDPRTETRSGRVSSTPPPDSGGHPSPAGEAPDPHTGTGSGFAPVPDSGGLVTTPLACEELVLATAPGGSRSAPGDLSGLSLVDFPAGWAIREVVDRAFAGRRVSLEADDLTAAASLVRAGLAACVLPASAAARFPEVTVRRFAASPRWQLAAIHRAHPSGAVTAVLAHLG
ncbi:LysR family transcriptional regulator [Amycolatopsis sp. NPDC088138]|uniref:LysR family transcriptional regulator n=1 Tax=Amycolatopsis sp. NPDC088138 TaxID=3363938 RepID=UPI0037F55B55